MYNKVLNLTRSSIKNKLSEFLKNKIFANPWVDSGKVEFNK